MKYKPDDIPYDLAYEAYRGISFSPDERAKQEQQAYVQHMSQMVKKYGHLPGAKEELERYRDGFIKHYCAWLRARSKVMSPMITGPAKFPFARNEKRIETERKRRNEFAQWKERAIDRLERNLGLRESAISGDDPDATDKLKAKLTKLIEAHEAMKVANKQARKEGAEPPYPAYKLTNSNANIRRVRQRIAELEARAEQESAEIAFDGGVIIDNVEANRVQIVFDAKPNEETRGKLKASGFRWAPSAGAWQRHRSVAAMAAAKRIVSSGSRGQ